jgi:hypothetical protein
VRRLPRRAPRPWAEEKSKWRQSALQLWIVFIKDYEPFCSLGRNLSRARPDERMVILQDTFEDKATSTIRGRGYSMMQYRHWAEKHSLRVFPITESKVYQFFCYSRGLGVAAARLTRFRDALAFSLYTIGIEMRYPKFQDVMGVFMAGDQDKIMELVLSCIKAIYTTDGEYHEITVDNQAELVEFVQDMTKEQFDMVETFFETMPKLVQTIEKACDKCGTMNYAKLEGLQNFFV